ncbi:MAG: hypothetical protein LBP33_07810 [Candidatus Adiutrix sp.]|jgi:hypothetical protein|nr:hypothetical protein [Candidatus Adiutrix sp.]
MLKGIFLAPGRLLARLFRRDRRKVYRSARSRSGAGPGTVILSLVAWLALAGALLYSIDQAGLLKQALDAGVEVAKGAEDDPTPPLPPPVRDRSTGGQLNTGPAGPSDAEIPPGSSHLNVSPSPAETEMWLVILHSIPKSARAEAERRQSQYLSRGLNVEILDTDAFPKLRPGNWIIAQGPFDDRASALAAANKAKAFNDGLMVRRGL